MAETISMPKLGFDMAEGLLVRWVKQVGENINKGDVLAEIETDKATVEVESSASGVVRKLLVEAGTIVPIGDAIAIIGSADEKIETPATDSGPKTPATPPPSPLQDASRGTMLAGSIGWYPVEQPLPPLITCLRHLFRSRLLHFR